MRNTLLLGLLPLAAHAINIVQSNDDGWAEINIRALYYSLTGAGFNTFISASALNESGTGSSDATPTTVGSSGCEFASCPPGSPAVGQNVSEPRFNYINSYPVTSMRYGIQNLSSTFFQGPPDLAVAGFNVGSNLGLITQISGTVGAATEAVKEGIPAIAFSGVTGTQTAWNATVEDYVNIYANLSTTVVETLTCKGEPYLPEDVYLNVNFPSVTSDCSSASSFQYVLSRIYPAIPLITKDVETCNSTVLPTERTVVGTDGCYVSVSVGTSNKSDASATQQAFVLAKLRNILICLPSS